MSDTKVLEVVTFNVKPGVSPGEAKTAARGVTAFLETQPGYLGRDLGQSEDGRWVDLVHWTDLEAARTAIPNAMKNADCRAFFALIDEETLKMDHFTVDG